MNILIIQAQKYHTEILGGILELLKNSIKHKLYIDILYVNHKNFIDIYKKNYENNKMIIKKIKQKDENQLYNTLDKINSKYDLFIYLTAPDFIYSTPSNKSILISHSIYDIPELKKTKAKIIAISALYKKYKIQYFNNVFIPKNINKDKDKDKDNKRLNLLIVGLNNEKDKDLLLKILKYKKQGYYENININIINYSVLSSKINKYNKYFKAYINISSIKFLNIIQKSDYILTMIPFNGSVYHTSQLSGIIPLALSYGIPMIIDNKTVKIYNLNKNICKIYKSHNNFLDILDDSNKLIDKINKYKKNIIIFRDKLIKMQKLKIKF